MLRAWYKHHIARSAIFGRRVLLYSSGCACVSFVIYLFCRRPDAKLNDVGENGEMYFRCVHPSQPQLSCKPASVPPLTCSVLGTCLSFLSVFITNMSMGRFWEARGDVGRICNHTRSLARKLLFTADDLARANEADRATIAMLLRYERAFFALLVQDLRSIHNLDIVPETFLLPSEKQRLLPVRRRSLMILGWMAVQVRQLVRAGKITERHEVMLMAHLDEMSTGYHGCTKIKSQPMPFSYAQLAAMLTLIFCVTVPVTFMGSFGWFLVAPTFVMGMVYFGINTVANQLADPFGTESDDINLDGFATQIQEDLDGYVRNWSSSGAEEASSDGPYQRTAYQP